MKKKVILLVLALLCIMPVFAAREYVTAGFGGGWSTGFDAPLINLHTSYQFGANFSESFDCGFGTYLDLDLGFSGFSSSSSNYTNGVTIAFGPAFGIDVSDMAFLNIIAGPDLDIYGRKKKNDNYAAVGGGISVAMSIMPPGEVDARDQLGFTYGITANAMWTENEEFVSSVKGFVGFSVRGPLLYSAYDPYF